MICIYFFNQNIKTSLRYYDHNHDNYTGYQCNCEKVFKKWYVFNLQSFLEIKRDL